MRSKTIYPLMNIKGLYWRNESGEVIVNEARPLIEALDDIALYRSRCCRVSTFKNRLSTVSNGYEGAHINVIIVEMKL